MAKRRKSVKRKSTSKAEVKPEPKPEIAKETEIPTPAVDVPVVETEVVPPPDEPVQCANCLCMTTRDKLFSCHHCGKGGCLACGWHKSIFQACPNCAMPVA